MVVSRVDDWFGRRTHAWADWSPADLVRAKRDTATRVSLVLPARDEAATVGDIVKRVRADLVDAVPLLDEVVVMDSDSADATAEVARAAGATVHRTVDVRPDLRPGSGKGEAMWKSLFVTTGDVVVFMDADLVDWDTHFVTGLLGPLLTDPTVALVKGFYDRLVGTGDPVHDAAHAREGGRVTELVARPLLSLHWPDLSGVVQPLAGEWAARRDLLGTIRLPQGYGVELAVLVDTYLARGLDAVAQVDLGQRAHRHQPLRDLALMALEQLVVVERRAGLATRSDTVDLRQPPGPGDAVPRSRTVGVAERPPAGSVPGAGA